jgi:hypothetical protein
MVAYLAEQKAELTAERLDLSWVNTTALSRDG